MLKLTGGEHRGRRLKWLDKPEIRPTPARVREAIFHVWGPIIENSRWWDLCSGSGVIGLEALSRGAEQVTFVEQNPRALELLKENIETLRLEEQSTLYRSRVQQFIKRQSTIDVDFIYFDPPYDDARLYAYVIEQLDKSKVNRPVTLCIEYRKRHKKWQSPQHWELIETREYGDVFLDILERHP